MTIPRLLVVDDDAEVRQMLTQFLRQNGAHVLPAASEHDIRRHMETGRIDLILLDVMLGDENGVKICERLRAEQDVPIIMVSALSADSDRMAGYAAGADDYIAKPFNTDLLLARIKAVLARARRSSSLAHRRRKQRFTFAGWVFDAKRDEVISPDGYQVALSRREIALLQVFLANPLIPLTRAEIAAALDLDGDGGADGQGRALDVLVGRLRTKIEADPKRPNLLRTERGVGYVLAVDVRSEDA
ncbi:response regulator transcription factor [Tropicibacter alexandrii]|uniref:response regulator transcription factor n=1 Tax=Tropicibacter alexandrii TaxID=2267683 RepID=UPI000EF4C60A|nr:response regulator transcription factor [Tropicibacter alexandrii]